MKHVWLALLACAVVAGCAAKTIEPEQQRTVYVEARDPRIARIDLAFENAGPKQPFRHQLLAKGGTIGEWIRWPVGNGQLLRATAFDEQGAVIAIGAAANQIGQEGLATVLLSAEGLAGAAPVGLTVSTYRLVLEPDPQGKRVEARITGPEGKPIDLGLDQAAWIIPGIDGIREPFDPRRPYFDLPPNRQPQVDPCLCLKGQPCLCLRPPPPIRYRTVTAGGGHACAIDEKGTAFCWGDDTFGQLGRGMTSALCSLPGYPYPYSVPCSTMPAAVQAPVPLVAISAGESHTCALDAGGAAYCWGANQEGQLGQGTVTAGGRPVPSATPLPVAGGRRFKALSAGDRHTCAIGTDDLVYCWGTNTRSQAGGIGSPTLTPRAIATTTFRSVSAGLEHTCGITTGGDVACWGRNLEGQLGVSTSLLQSDTPQIATVTPPVLPPPAVVAAGGNVSCVGSQAGYFVTQGSISCFGGSATVASGAQRFFSITRQLTLGGTPSADDFICARDAGNTALCWGNNVTGRLGVGSGLPAVVAQPRGVVQPPPSFTDIDAGGLHICGVASDGRVFCWGSNGRGQLGNGTQVDASVPTLVPLTYLTPSRFERLFLP